MTVFIHLLDDASPVLIDGTLSNVVSGDEEGSMTSPGLELLHNTLSVDVWAVVIGYRNRAGVVADVDTCATVGDASKLRARNVARAFTIRGLVGVTSWSEVEQAVRRLAVFLGSSTVSS